jgi:hypothetical protein
MDTHSARVVACASGTNKERSTTYKPTLAARIDRSIYRLRNTNGLPLRPVGDDSDPEPREFRSPAFQVSSVRRRAEEGETLAHEPLEEMAHRRSGSPPTFRMYFVCGNRVWRLRWSLS